MIFYSSLTVAGCADGTSPVAGEKSPGKFEVVRTVRTPQGARATGVDPTAHTVYSPAAEFEEAQAGARPRAKPGTFMIVVARQDARQ